MARRRRNRLWPLILAVLLVALWCMPLSAREPASGPEGYHLSNTADSVGLGDDDDDDFNITSPLACLLAGVWSQWMRFLIT